MINCKYYRKWRKEPVKLIHRELCHCEDNHWGAGSPCSYKGPDSCKYYEEGTFNWGGFEYYDDYLNFRKDVKKKWSKNKWKDFFAHLVSIFTFGFVKPGIVPIRLFSNGVPGDVSLFNTNTNKLLLYSSLLCHSYNNPWYKGTFKGCSIYTDYEVGWEDNKYICLDNSRRGYGKVLNFDHLTFEVIKDA